MHLETNITNNVLRPSALFSVWTVTPQVCNWSANEFILKQILFCWYKWCKEYWRCRSFLKSSQCFIGWELIYWLWVWIFTTYHNTFQCLQNRVYIKSFRFFFFKMFFNNATCHFSDVEMSTAWWCLFSSSQSSSLESFQGFAVPTPKVPVLPPLNGPKINGSGELLYIKNKNNKNYILKFKHGKC